MWHRPVWFSMFSFALGSGRPNRFNCMNWLCLFEWNHVSWYYSDTQTRYIAEHEHVSVTWNILTCMTKNQMQMRPTYIVHIIYSLCFYHLFRNWVPNHNFHDLLFEIIFSYENSGPCLTQLYLCSLHTLICSYVFFL